MCLPGTVGISSGELRAPPFRHASRSRRPAPRGETAPTPGSAYGRATPNLRPTPASSIQIDARFHPGCRRADEGEHGIQGAVSVRDEGTGAEDVHGTEA